MARFRLNEERENLFALYQVLHPEVLSNLVGTEIFGLEQEVSLAGKKVDISGWAEEIKQKVYVEVQLIPADNRHLEKVKEIINDIDKGIAIWEALSFIRREYLIEEVIEFAKVLNKPVKVLFVEINPAVIPTLGQLAGLYPLDVIPSLSRLSMVGEPLKRIREYMNSGVLTEINGVQGSGQQCIFKPYSLEPITSRLGANKYILQQIRDKIPYFPGGYRAKSRLDTNAIVFGAGNGNMFEISVRESYSHVKLRIPKTNTSTCVQLKKDKMMIENRIGYRIDFKEERTSYIVDVSIKSCGRRRTDVLDEVVQVFKAFVEFFTKYFYEMEKERKVVGVG